MKTSVVPASRNTSFMRAIKTGNHQLATTGTRVILEVIQLEDSGGQEPIKFTKAEQAALDLVRHLPEVRQLPLKLKATLGSQKVPNNILVVNSGNLCATHEWQSDDELEYSEVQTVRAAIECHGRPWNDCVRVLGEMERSNEQQHWYCQIRLLFHCEGSQYMFVRWFEQVAAEQSDILSKYGCVPLKLTEEYDVVDFSSALCREYIVPDFNREGHYHASAFKWDRSPVALAKDKVDSHGRILSLE